MNTLCPCSLNISKTVGLKKKLTERKIYFIFSTTLVRNIFQSAVETRNDPVRERKRRSTSVCWRRSLFSWTTSEISQTLVRLTPDASSDRGSSNSGSCLQRNRSVCYTPVLGIRHLNNTVIQQWYSWRPTYRPPDLCLIRNWTLIWIWTTDRTRARVPSCVIMFMEHHAGHP
jgi:hypothetical protein